jgi:tetratricopeptide (TPR) repeat protein
LSFAPDHPTAREMLLQLGYELPTSQYPAVPDGLEPAGMRSDLGPEASDTFDASDTKDTESKIAVHREAFEETRGFDPHEQPTMGGLPSFPMEEEPATASMKAPSSGPVPAVPSAEYAPSPASAEVPVSHGASAAEAESPRPRGASVPAGESIEAALDEAEFFLSRGLFDDARAIIEEHLRRAPTHPILLERLRELDLTVAQAFGTSGTRERPQHGDAEPQDDHAFDIAASLGELDASASELQKPDDQIDVEEVFAKFKAGVKAQISETDSATHYDLGLAYREMDLLTDAIDEFRLAARDPKRECVCQSMVGMICRAQGDVNGAVEAFVKGLHAEHKTPEQELSLYYELGDAYESKGNGSEALYYFRKVAHRAPKHNDPRGSIDVRIRTVQALAHRPSRERAVGAPDDFDAAFDAALGGGKQL